MSRNDWPERTRRPTALKLTQAQAAPILKALTNAIRKSVVLMELHHSIRFARGRFYLERMVNYGVSNEIEVVARVTPLSDPPGVLLLESGGSHHWHTIK